ncbi:MAG: type 3 dihydrofolate reductase [Candidatus Thiodiazotropha sp. (ex Lucinoma aequizonata)]|nr:type 3 dihydrofolate reductase [Candidatus Thiodiazotropha sp. (ex Lucinoma aequizonata)]MCU7888933.1 type 3 dihydrofolate reductase [Candidatus Thiodiazotropha sp. (ex Lucinoma aequizonata)]MCU7896386.1 type 3 dihydrofolate reductase [Candidatus Thiodiazotropha sp. (ex Lucinoma aequizonata)]MCU7899559.1 type 3 dihydrofolate reductase [Candidatus Thiodiazotropha sp. (ex Lucinoma aequizonata)]MCU7901953.1 type 3 dihydrofolate reductase [Candidatus Thiodiazotropha sp. (ex Lucinoma aequizonata)
MIDATPIISLIAAMAKNGVIGCDDRLPWHLPADLKHFKALTLGKPIVMGRRTWGSLPGILPGRQHIVVTRDQNYRAQGCRVVYSVDEAMQAVAEALEVMVVGGGGFYEAMLPRADRLYLTLVEADIEGDTYFPEIDWEVWQEVSREHHLVDDRNAYPYTFLELNRSSPD